MSNIKISVIVPCYNVASLLPRGLDSLVNQTLDDIEIICVDDKSTDDTLMVLNEYASRDPRIRVIALDENSGAAVARNVGMDVATGQWLAFMDADDYVDSDYYEKMYDTAIQNPDADIIKSDAKITEYDGSRRFDDRQMARIRMFGKWRFMYQWWTGMYRGDMIRKNNIRFPSEIISGQDVVFLTECVAVASKIALCPNAFYHYIRRTDSLDEQILSPVKIESKLNATMLMCDKYNTSDMSEDDYFACYHDRFVMAKSMFDRNTLYECKCRVAETLINLYKNCRDKYKLIDMHLSYCPDARDYVPYIQSYDVANLVKYFTGACPGGAQSGKRPESRHQVLLFNCIPIAQVNNGSRIKMLRVFGIQVLKIKHSGTSFKMYVLYIPIIRIKKK